MKMNVITILIGALGIFEKKKQKKHLDVEKNSKQSAKDMKKGLLSLVMATKYQRWLD